MAPTTKTCAAPTPAATAVAQLSVPNLGLVCITDSEECRFRTITRTRLLTLPAKQQRLELLRLYWDNLSRLHWTLTFCQRRGIRLYRATSGLFPHSDGPPGVEILQSMAANLSAVGRRVERLGIRMVLHPDQFVVLNSESPQVARTSRLIMDKHARSFNLFGLPRTPWAAMTLHGGKAGRGDELVRVVRDLPEAVRGRLVLENDEYTYGAAEILDVCRRAGVPMVFDAHHHAVKEGLDSYEHPSVEHFTRAARGTWPDPAWQIVHLSNGKASFRDRNHSDLISAVPSAFRDVPWVEVEARAKERAIEGLRASWLGAAAG